MTETDRIIAAAQDASDGARAAWTCLTIAPLPSGWARKLVHKGFLQNDLRFLRGDEWMFSAVLNQGWVLWYARRPAIRAGIVDPDAMRASFPESRIGNDGEIKLRLHDGRAAGSLLDWSLGRDQGAPARL